VTDLARSGYLDADNYSSALPARSGSRTVTAIRSWLIVSLVPAAIVGFVTAATIASSTAPTWALADPIPHVFDVAGPTPAGSLVVAAGGKLFLLHPTTGALTRFAAGPKGYPGAGGEEPYIAVPPEAAVAHADFGPGDVFVLQLKPAGGILQIDSAGVARPFANVRGVDSLNGITFDGTGAFGYRLLVTGPHAHRTTVAAIDHTGAVNVITNQAPTVEGGIAVAPSGFGLFARDLIAPDELSGTIYAIAPDGSTPVVTRPNLARGGDVGVEGAGFIPQVDDPSTLTAYFADRGTPGNPHPGSDNLLAVPGSELVREGALPGDLLVATEGGAALVDVRCGVSSCAVRTVLPDNAVSHGEGHLLVVANAPAPTFSFGRGSAQVPPELDSDRRDRRPHRGVAGARRLAHSAPAASDEIRLTADARPRGGGSSCSR